MPKRDFTPEQCRAGRALLGWSQQQLAEASKLHRKTIAAFEGGSSTVEERTIDDLKEALEEGGVVFIPENGEGPGVRLRRKPRRL